jgi:hypothetical protein
VRGEEGERREEAAVGTAVTVARIVGRLGAGTVWYSTVTCMIMDLAFC